VNRNVILLDPAHGGPDAGASLGGGVLEKDVTLALAGRMRTALTAAGFLVVSTQDGDPAAVLSADDRADAANRARPLACVVLHATGSGSGVHVFTSMLQPAAAVTESDGEGFTPTPWDEAQAAFVAQSGALRASLFAALGKANLPELSGHAALRPLDNFTCAAVAVEVAPLLSAGGDATPVTDGDYQQRVAGSLAAGLRAYRDQTAAAASAAGQGSGQ
jgi:N-acetylmuramoyl-L-alanine amidase